jgi:hypothetical protein
LKISPERWPKKTTICRSKLARDLRTFPTRAGP